MPSLVLLKSPSNGAGPSTQIPLSADQMVIGRDENDCQIVIPHHAVNRKHAQIVRAGNQYFIEDLRSRNKTFVNGKEVPPLTRQELKPDDRIKICDFLFRFHDEHAIKPTALPDWLAKSGKTEDETCLLWGEVNADMQSAAAPPTLQIARRNEDAAIRKKYPGEYVAYKDEWEAPILRREIIAHDRSLKIVHAALAHLSEAELTLVRVTYCDTPTETDVFRGGYDNQLLSDTDVRTKSD